IGPAASAAVIAGVTVDSVSSELVGNYRFPPDSNSYWYNRPASVLVDGLFATTTDPNDHTNSKVTGTGVGSGNHIWNTEGVNVVRQNGTLTSDRSPFVRFKLNGRYTLDSLTVYNYNIPPFVLPPPGETSFTQRGVKTARITLIDGGVSNDMGVFTFNQAPG